jgi:AraC family transcriptional regulator, regulatory protein of adaptative response / methylphosphotriester-DNA alkyltransferase methyltransferase
METLTYSPASDRQKQIVRNYLDLLDKHMSQLRTGSAEKTLEISDFADHLHIHPRHLSNTIHEVTGTSPCDIYERRLLEVSKEMLRKTNLSISQIARQLTYDPSNFTKFFKQYEGSTPKAYRKSLAIVENVISR